MLKDILALLKQDGVNTNDATQKAAAIIKINNACKRLYNKADLDGAIDESLLQVHVASHQAALPREIGEIRMLRAGYLQHPIPLWDAYQRYHESGDTRVSYLNYRVRPSRPLQRSLDNASLLAFTIPLADTVANSFVVIGKGENANNIVETVTIAAGDLEAATVNSFEDVRQILRTGGDTYDSIVYDADDIEVAVIPNNASESIYKVIQVIDSDYQSASNVSYYPVEVLYQKALHPMVRDNDSFVCGDKYDEAIFWETKLFDAAKQKDNTAYQAAETMVNSIVANIGHNTLKGKAKRMDVAEPGIFKLTSMIRRSYRCDD